MSTVPLLQLLLVAALVAAPSANAAGSDACQSKAKLGEIYDCYWQAAYAEAVTEPVAEAVGATNNPTTTPDAFANRIHASYESFLEQLSFAINKVEESADGQALVVRFNPVRQGPWLLGLSATAAKPVVSKDLLEAIPATQRPAVAEALGKQIEDTDDITTAGVLSVQTVSCRLDNSPATRCWGRSPSTYRGALAALLVDDSDDQAGEPDGWFELAAKLADALDQLDAGCRSPGSVFDKKLTCVVETKRANALSWLAELATREAERTAASRVHYEAAGFGNLATLIDNQPQLSLTGSYRSLGRLIGGDEATASLELHFGLTNLNSVYRHCATDPNGHTSCVRSRLAAFQSDSSSLTTDKLVLTASYKRRNAFEVPSLTVPDDVPLDFSGYRTDETTELKLRFQLGRQLRANLGRKLDLGGSELVKASTTASPKKARWDLSLEGIRNTKDGIRTENRWVASWGLSLPLTDDVLLPVTVTYANKPEFLTDQRKSLSAHVGISYRLPWEK